MEVVDAVAVFNWLFSEKVTPHFTRQYVWDILESTVLKTNRFHDQSIKQLADTNEALKKVRSMLSLLEPEWSATMLRVDYQYYLDCIG